MFNKFSAAQSPMPFQADAARQLLSQVGPGKDDGNGGGGIPMGGFASLMKTPFGVIPNLIMALTGKG